MITAMSNMISSLSYYKNYVTEMEPWLPIQENSWLYKVNGIKQTIPTDAINNEAFYNRMNLTNDGKFSKETFDDYADLIITCLTYNSHPLIDAKSYIVNILKKLYNDAQLEARLEYEKEKTQDNDYK